MEITQDQINKLSIYISKLSNIIEKGYDNETTIGMLKEKADIASEAQEILVAVETRLK